MNKNLLQAMSSLLLITLSLAFIACQNKMNANQGKHVENTLAIEKAYYWHDMVEGCLNSNRYADAMIYLDSLKQFCNYYEEACYIYAWIYLKSSQENYDEQKGMKYLMQAAYGIPDCKERVNERSARGYSGLLRAKFDLALIYLYGNNSVKKDEAKAIQILDTLSKADYAGGHGSIKYDWNGDFVGPKAKIMLASFYENGSKGLQQDFRKAAQLWDEALVMTGKYYMDSADLLELIGKRYKDTNNPYYKDVTAWLLNDAKPEEPTTQILLALCYRMGRGVPKDIQRSNNMLQGISLSQEMGDALYPLMDYISGR